MKHTLMNLSCYLALAIAAVACGDVNNTNGTPDAAMIDAVAAAPTCAEYCSSLAANCTTLPQYKTPVGAENLCLSTCAKFPMGTAADRSGNTLGCRAYHATAAAGSAANATTHCPHAGPTGADVCGSPCDSFCSTVLASCTAANVQYGGSMATCTAACAGYAKTRIYSPATTGGDDFACRMYHATNAAANPGVHCKHTAVDGGGVCVGVVP
jgi:hypothetical protein